MLDPETKCSQRRLHSSSSGPRRPSLYDRKEGRRGEAQGAQERQRGQPVSFRGAQFALRDTPRQPKTEPAALRGRFGGTLCAKKLCSRCRCDSRGDTRSNVSLLLDIMLKDLSFQHWLPPSPVSTTKKIMASSLVLCQWARHISGLRPSNSFQRLRLGKRGGTDRGHRTTEKRFFF